MDLKRDTLPSERAAAEAKAKSDLDKRAELRSQSMREDFGKTFRTEHGQRVLAWLRERCGHNKVILSALREGGIDEKMTTFAAMELNLYLEIRKYIPITILQEIEYDRVEPSGSIREPISGNTVERKRSRANRRG